MEVRTIITEALSRANIVPRRQPAPGDLVMTAFQLLQGLISQYNKDNYLSFTQASLDLPSKRYIHIYDDTDTMLDANNRVFQNMTQLSENPPTSVDYADGALAYVADGAHENMVFYVTSPVQGVYIWVPSAPTQEFDPRYQQMKRYCECYHVHVHNVVKLNSLMVNRGDVYGMLQLNFAPYSEFDAYVNSDLYWTWNDYAEGEWLVVVKPLVASQSNKLRLHYNKGFQIDLNSDVRIPDNYLELLIVSLTHKLAVKFPRLDDAQMIRLENEVKNMLSNVRTPKADAKMVVRENHWDRGYNATDVLQGRMFY
mgnify:CR=1 FL=1